MKRKLITLLLCMTLLVSALSLMGCPAADDDKKNNEVVNKLEHLEGLNFEGEVIDIVYVEGGNGQFTERSLGLAPDEDTGDAVDTKVYQRNETVQTMLNVEISPFAGASGFGDLSGAINASLAANSGEYDIIAGYQYFDIGLAAEGYLINLNNLASETYNAGHMRLDADYWSGAYNDAISYNGATYWVTGDLALRYLGGMYCTFVNGNIYDDVLKEKYGSIYDVVRSNEWTLDKFYEMLNACYVDENGDEETDEEDQLGFVLETSMDPIDGMAFGSQIAFSSKTDAGVNVVLHNTRTITFGEKMAKILASEAFFAPEGADSHNQMAIFAGGTVCFTVASVFHSEVGLREMEHFYIVPVPKLDTNQATYSSGVHDGVTLFGIPYDCVNVPAAAATLEAMAAESQRIVTPEYYDSALKYKYTRDQEAAEMIDLIRDCAYTDFAAAWSQDINDIVHFFRSNSAKLNGINSSLKKLTDKWSTSMGTLLEKLDTYATE